MRDQIRGSGVTGPDSAPATRSPRPGQKKLTFLEKLREATEKATPGPWEYSDIMSDGMAWIWNKDRSGKVYVRRQTPPQEKIDMQFTALANPQTIKWLLDMLDRTLDAVTAAKGEEATARRNIARQLAKGPQ